MFVWVSAARFAPVMVATLTKVIMGTQTLCMDANPMITTRSNMAQAAAFTATDMNPVTVVGAPS